jgi:hypothetical protein
MRHYISACSLLLLALIGLGDAQSVHASPLTLVEVPYRSQLDGSRYGPANCGPTAIGMALDAFGVSASSWDLRVAAMKLQGTWGEEYRDEWGVFIYNLERVVRQYGLHTAGLYTREGTKPDQPRSWTADDIRAQLDLGRLVITQLELRSMPGRSGSPYTGDHFVVVHGYEGDAFIYSDPLPQSGGGPNLHISATALMRAMERSEGTGSAFALWR